MGQESEKSINNGFGKSNRKTRYPWSKMLYVLGAIIGNVIGLCMVYVAYQHDPQGSVSESPFYMLFLWLSWAITACIPFVAIGLIVRFVFKK